MRAKYFLLGALALTMMACEKDFFETKSPSAMDEAVFKSADMTEQAIGAIYNAFGEDKSFRNRLCGGYVALNTDIEHASKTEDAEYAAYNMTGGTGNLSTSNGKDPWAYLNSAIERCNVVIDGIRAHSDLSDASFKYLLGEALTLRSFCYLEMVKLWGDVPASFESFNGYNPEVLYTKKQDRNVVFEQLRVDLKEAAELMPWSASIPVAGAANFTGRPSKALAYGLLARADMMYAGLAMRPDVFTEGGTSACSVQYNLEGNPGKRQELYQEVVWACAQVIKQEDWKFKDDFAQVFKDLCQDVTDYSKSEWIWALPFLDGARGQVLALTGNKISTNCAGAIVNSISYGDGNTNNTKTQAMIEIVPTFYYQYDKADKRRNVTILPWTWEYDTGEGTSSETETAFPGVPASEKKLYQKQSNIAQLYCGKLRIEWMKRSYASNEDCVDMPVLRYTDILLMFAEAAIGSRENNAPGDLYGIDPQACMDKVRARAGVPSVPVTFANIVDERAFEFCGENIRKYDLMRWGLLKEKLEKAQADSYDLQNNQGAYAGRPDSVWFHFKQDNSFAQKGAAYVFDRFIGLDLGAERPAEFDKTAGWVVKDFFYKDEVPFMSTDKWYLYKPETDIDMHQYWPIFDVNIAASNGTLWNDYLY